MTFTVIASGRTADVMFEMREKEERYLDDRVLYWFCSKYYVISGMWWSVEMIGFGLRYSSVFINNKFMVAFYGG